MNLVESWGSNPIGWVAAHLIEAPVNIFTAVTNPGQWLGWLPYTSWDQRIGDKEAGESLLRFIYYGASWELFFAILFVFLVYTIIGMFRKSMLWATVRGLEWFGNATGRFFAWAGLIMVIQQIMIVFMQRIFAVPEISLGIGNSFTKDVSWWAEELKLYNAIIVCMCVSYTFIQGGHVRVDLIYAPVRFRVKKIIDMFGSLFFMVPAAVITYFYGWFFLWRHMVTPKLSASDASKEIDKVLNKARALKFNVETIGFSPNGFNGYFLFKVLLVAFCILVILQAVAFFYRSYLEYVEGPESENKYLDKDVLGDEQAELVAEIH